MNKNEENSAKSSTWAEEQFRKEADELVKRLETDDRFDDFEPPEELFQKLVVEARDEGLLEEENTKHLEDETKSTEENTKENQNTKVVKFFNHRISKKFLGMTAAAVISCFGLFGVSMSTQGGRSYVMDKANEVLGDEKNTEIENGEDRLITDRTEEARNEIEEKLQVEVPQFFYLPDKMDFDSYEIDETAQSVFMKYQGEDTCMYFVIQANYVNTSGIYRNDEGIYLDKIESDISQNVEVELWRIQDEEDYYPTYLAQWDYKNSYYRISGKITEDEIKEIIKNIMY